MQLQDKFELNYINKFHNILLYLPKYWKLRDTRMCSDFIEKLEII